MVWQLVMHYFSFLSGMITTIIALCTVLSLICALLFMTIRTLIRNRWRTSNNNQTIVGFFHPYCNAGGGGERVLWCAIRALQNKYGNIKCVVYTGDVDATPEEILNQVQTRFSITLVHEVRFVYLTQRKWVEMATYPYFTILGQSIGSMLLGLEALLKLAPDIYIDTMGYAFTIPIFKYIGGCKVGCYVHYPTVNTDMLQRVVERRVSHTNASAVSNNRLLSSVKVVYYQLFAMLYGFAGRCSDAIMVNSSWTRQHILQLWRQQAITFLIYPPCNVTEFRDIPLYDDGRKTTISIVSIGQFRPEKDHRLQIQAFRLLLDNVSESIRSRLRLELIGGCRNEEDEKRVQELQLFCKELNIQENVYFYLNISFADMKHRLESATIGLHTMWNEHFGIGVVECMAAGLVTLAHDSGGPKMDIVTEYEGRPTGFLASDAHGFADAMEKIIVMNPEKRLEIRQNARNSTSRFSEFIFETNFLIVFDTYFFTTQ